MMRSGIDRRKFNDPNYTGPERRSGKERRSGRDRRKRTWSSRYLRDNMLLYHVLSQSRVNGNGSRVTCAVGNHGIIRFMAMQPLLQYARKNISWTCCARASLAPLERGQAGIMIMKHFLTRGRILAAVLRATSMPEARNRTTFILQMHAPPFAKLAYTPPHTYSRASSRPTIFTHPKP